MTGLDIIKIPKEELTPREIDVLTLTAQGKLRPEIAATLLISQQTVKEYIKEACHKLGAKNKAQASVLAVLLGLIAPYRPSGLMQNRTNYQENLRHSPRTGGAIAENHQLLRLTRPGGSTKISNPVRPHIERANNWFRRVPYGCL